jgi:phospholipid N-methyltransferase
MTSLIRHMLRNPLNTGAILPSSRHLAEAMARAAGSARHVVELGAGTGPVTQALMAALPAASLVAVELQGELAARLRTRFPGLDVRQAPASVVLDSLNTPAENGGLVAVVSSLPFRSLPAQVCKETIASVCRFLLRHPDSLFVQFTYQPRAPFQAPGGFAWARVDVVWRNAPPAGVWVMRQVTSG